MIEFFNFRPRTVLDVIFRTDLLFHGFGGVPFVARRERSRADFRGIRGADLARRELRVGELGEDRRREQKRNELSPR